MLSGVWTTEKAMSEGAGLECMAKYSYAFAIDRLDEKFVCYAENVKNLLVHVYRFMFRQHLGSLM